MLCDLKEDLLEELDLLKNVFISNGYPEKLVSKTITESWPRETLKAVLKGFNKTWKWRILKIILKSYMPLC